MIELWEALKTRLQAKHPLRLILWNSQDPNSKEWSMILFDTVDGKFGLFQTEYIFKHRYSLLKYKYLFIMLHWGLFHNTAQQGVVKWKADLL